MIYWRDIVLIGRRGDTVRHLFRSRMSRFDTRYRVYRVREPLPDFFFLFRRLYKKREAHAVISEKFSRCSSPVSKLCRRCLDKILGPGTFRNASSLFLFLLPFIPTLKRFVNVYKKLRLLFVTSQRFCLINFKCVRKNSLILIFKIILVLSSGVTALLNDVLIIFYY